MSSTIWHTPIRIHVFDIHQSAFYILHHLTYTNQHPMSSTIWHTPISILCPPPFNIHQSVSYVLHHLTYTNQYPCPPPFDFTSLIDQPFFVSNLTNNYLWNEIQLVTQHPQNTEKIKPFTTPTTSFVWSIKHFPVLKDTFHKTFLLSILSPPLRIAHNRCQTSCVDMAATPVKACSPNTFASRPNYFLNSNNRPPTLSWSRFPQFQADLPFSMSTCSFQGKHGYGRNITSKVTRI